MAHAAAKIIRPTAVPTTVPKKPKYSSRMVQVLRHCKIPIILNVPRYSRFDNMSTHLFALEGTLNKYPGRIINTICTDQANPTVHQTGKYCPFIAIISNDKVQIVTTRGATTKLPRSPSANINKKAFILNQLNTHLN
ncbi:Hypothetical protein NTJ_00038 [Nesidiocoris tenuis]|uniref:Uncharacterized protein n=1 Tax=Nesidiocoris tenuis TaxID=355587 RepID=A0ABN7A5U0_9HEMI|nr:Hypothetical protein NTJ_00038 [Nesidiocoris tenuis]